MSDPDKPESPPGRYVKAAWRVSRAVVGRRGAPDQTRPQLRAGLDLSKSDHAGLVTLLVEKGVFTMEEYLEAIAKQAEEEADMQEEARDRWLAGDRK